MPVEHHTHSGGDSAPALNAAEALVDGSIPTPKIGDNQVTNVKVADAALTKTKLVVDTIQWGELIPVIAETARTGLVADATGVKWESIDLILNAAEIQSLKGIYVEGTWVASVADSVTAIELYNVTAAAVICSISGNTGTNIRSTAGSPVAGNIMKVRVNVTTASATAGATTGANKAVIILVFGVS